MPPDPPLLDSGFAPAMAEIPRRRRIAAACLLGLVAAGTMLVLWPALWPHISSDLDPIILGARSLWRGTDPYLDS